jgi:hypothetical protein
LDFEGGGWRGKIKHQKPKSKENPSTKLPKKAYITSDAGTPLGRFPLTPALSLGERENGPPRVCEAG